MGKEWAGLFFPRGKNGPAHSFPGEKTDWGEIPACYTGTYILQTNRAKFNQNDVNPICQLCHKCEETPQHFIIDCEALAEDRDPILNDFLTVLRSLLDIYPQAADYSLLQLLIDSSCLIDTDIRVQNDILTHIDSLNYHSRRLIYKIHASR